MKLRSVLCLSLVLSLSSLAPGNESSADLIAKGDSLDVQLQTADALDAYLAAEKLAPENPELLIKIAKQYGEAMVDLPDKDDQLASGRKALDYAKRAVDLAPNLSDAQLAVAICYGRLLDLVSAREKVEYSRLIKQHTEQALKLNENSDYAWHMLGRWHRAVATTGPLLKGIVEIVYGGLPDASEEEAVEAFKKAIALNPDRVAHHIELGLTYADIGEPQKAEQEIRKGLSLPSKERDDPDTKARGKEVLDELKD